jgi:glyoxylase-like metal-dependent hydrolase (beta-lactamase superfamily II)
MKLGDLTLTLVNGGNFRLDGGAMHGAVPKTVWSKLVSCDELNRCEYATNCLLVDGPGFRVLIETGNGDKLSAKERRIYGIDHDQSCEKNLRAIGVEPESITHVIMTHLHFDHAGGTTRSDGRAIFSRARHVVQAKEWHDASHPHERNAASYLQENLKPLADAQLIDPVDGEREIAPGVRVLPTPGHTRGHQSVLLTDGNGHHVVFLGDVVPTSLHVRLPYIMGYDLDVVGTLESKRAIFERALEEKWLLVFGHDHEKRAGYLGLDARGQFTLAEPFSL